MRYSLGLSVVRRLLEKCISIELRVVRSLLGECKVFD